MKKVAVLGIIALMVMGGLVVADDEFNGPIKESYVGQNHSYTNLTGGRLKLSVAAYSGTFDSSTNSTITLTDGNNNILLVSLGVSSTIAWADGETSYSLEKNAVITAFTPTTAGTTNWAYILTKQ